MLASALPLGHILSPNLFFWKRITYTLNTLKNTIQNYLFACSFMPFAIAKDTKNAMAQWGENPFLAEALKFLDKKLLHVPALGHRLIKQLSTLSLFGKEISFYFLIFCV